MVLKDTGKNINGSLSRLNKVREVNMTAGFKSCPANEYVTKERTDAIAGRDNATALLPDRRRRRDRT
jgi:hypothetical protein